MTIRNRKRGIRLRLSSKLLITQILVFLIVYAAVFTITPELVYSLTSRGEAEAAMLFNEQIAMRIEQRFSELERFSSVVATDAGLNDLLEKAINEYNDKNNASLRLYLSNIIQRDGVSTYRVLGMYLQIDGETPFDTNTVGMSAELKEYIQKKILPQYEKTDGKGMFIEPFVLSDSSESYFGNTFNQGYGYVCPYDMNGMSGRLVIISSYDEIIYIANDLGDYCSDYLLMTDSDSVVSPSVQNSHIDYSSFLKKSDFGESYQEKYLIQDDGVYSLRYVDNTNWKIISYLNRDEVLAKNQNQSYMILLSIGIYSVIVIVALVLIVNKFTKPLGEVSRQMGAISQGDFGARVTIPSGRMHGGQPWENGSQDEIWQVTESFNVMAERLEEMIQEILEKESAERTMRYNLLISQVDPHFIYNTMNTITYLAQKGRNEDVIVVNKAMIEILRDRLRIEMDEACDTIEQEVKVVRQYLIIQTYRYEGMFRVKYFIDPEVKECLIAKSILQPLVENALAHGILENKDENGEPLGGCITIVVKKQEANIRMEVTDNGVGMSEERVTQIMNGAGTERGKQIGIRNIRERIHYIYQSGESLEIYSKEGEGTTVRLLLPMKHR